MTQSDRTPPSQPWPFRAAASWCLIAQFDSSRPGSVSRRHEAPEQQRRYKTNKKRQPINTCERHARIHAGFISISVKMGGTSSSIPHRLNNSRWSTSFLNIKKKRLHAAWVFVWAVEGKTAVSCQGERSEIISIIYGCNVQKRRMQGGGQSQGWEMHKEGEMCFQPAWMHRENCVLGKAVVANMSTFTRELPLSNHCSFPTIHFSFFPQHWMANHRSGFGYTFYQ